MNQTRRARSGVLDRMVALHQERAIGFCEWQKGRHHASIRLIALRTGCRRVRRAVGVRCRLARGCYGNADGGEWRVIVERLSFGVLGYAEAPPQQVKIGHLRRVLDLSIE